VGLTALARDDEKIQALVAGRTVVRIIAVPDKLINIVVK
jgi:leucyl-tRNA synthetase